MSAPTDSAAADPLGLRRQPVPGLVLDYFPADGAVCRVNPPAFRWIPATVPDARYGLEIARDAGFRDRVGEASGIAWHVEVPTRVLPPGRYFWRFGVESAGGRTEWSPARSFTIPPDAVAFPFPEGDYAGRVPSGRPRLFFAGATLDACRRLARTDECLRKSIDRLLGDTEHPHGEPLVPEPPFLPEDPTIRGGAYTDIFRATRPPMDRMERLAMVHLLTGDRAAGLEAKRRLFHFLDWDNAGSTNVFHNDEPAMWIMMRGPSTYDWIHGLCGLGERRFVEERLLARGRDLFELLRQRPFDSNPFESHAGRMTAILGAAALSLAPEYPEARGWLDYVLRIYYGAYPCWGGDDGGWNEGSAYWRHYMIHLLEFIVPLRQAAGVDLLRKPFFRRTPYYLYHSLPPFSRHRTYGDGTPEDSMAESGMVMGYFARLLGDPGLQYYAEQTGGTEHGELEKLAVSLMATEPPPARPPTDEPASIHFADIGMVSMRNTLVDADRHVGMLFMANPFGNVSHNHNNQNTFTIEAHGEALAVATGYYEYYGSPHHEGWTRQTKSKCGITTDGGQGQDRGWQATAKITRFEDRPGFTLTAGDATPAYGGRLSRAVREIVFIKSAGVFVVRDDLAAPTGTVFEYRLHALEAMRMDADRRAVTITRPNAALEVVFLEPGSLTFSLTDRFDVPVAERSDRGPRPNAWHFTAATARGRSATFLSVLAAVKTGERAPAIRRLDSPSALGAEIVLPDGRRFIAGFARTPGGNESELAGAKSTESFFGYEG